MWGVDETWVGASEGLRHAFPVTVRGEVGAQGYQPGVTGDGATRWQ